MSRSSAVIVPSPCISVCRLDPDTRRCEGCHRSLSEIERWMYMSNAERMLVWVRVSAQRGLPLEAALAAKAGAAQARAWLERHVERP